MARSLRDVYLVRDRDERAIHRIVVALQREGEMTEDTAPDVVDAAVDELERDAGLRQIGENGPLRRVAVAERQGHDATRMPLPQRDEFGIRGHSPHDGRHEPL